MPLKTYMPKDVYKIVYTVLSISYDVSVKYNTSIYLTFNTDSAVSLWFLKFCLAPDVDFCVYFL